MEFPELANACTYRGCMEKNDFLPFTCNGCNKKFCLAHHRHENHECPVPARDDKYAPVCPLCMQAVTIKPGQDANRVMDQHIRAGCPDTTVKTRKNACSHPGCREKEFVPVSCKLCKLPFCLKHRFETDHDCAVKKAAKPQPPQPKPAPKPAPAPSPAKPQSSAATAAGMAAAGRASANGMAAGGGGGAGAGGGGGGGGGGTSQARRTKAKHSNSPSAAVGASGIPQSERLLLSVYFPVASARPPEFHVVSVRWSVGKVTDTLADRGRIRNDNLRAGAARLCLFSHRGERLAHSDSMEQCVLQGQVEGGSAVMLEYGETLVDFDPKALSAVKAKGKDCVLM